MIQEVVRSMTNFEWGAVIIDVLVIIILAVCVIHLLVKLREQSNNSRSEQSTEFLKTIYDHSKQLVTLSTATAAVFATLTPASSTPIDPMIFVFGFLALSGVVAM